MNVLGRGSWIRRVAVVAALAVAVATTVTVQAQSASADDYPSWADVEAARNNEAATAAAIAQIQGLLAGLEAQAKATQVEADAKGAIFQKADDKFQAANAKAQLLQQQADAASAKASGSEQRAGQLAAQLARSGGGNDVTTNLLLNSGDADDLLYGLGMSAKISEQANAIYDLAIVDKNTAQALTDQANVAKRELEVFKVEAEKAFTVAQTAAIAASTALNEQRDHQAQLQQQIIVLTENRAATEADYLAGVRQKFATDAGLDAGEISDTGWVKPAGGYITSPFGWRILYGAQNFHKGTDLGAGCDANIYAASGGTVIYASYGWNGGYGNMIMIDHGNGVVTRYGHIVDDGILVSYGQSVGVGTTIAHVGTTGDSTGCHLHFEVILDGVATDPEPFMSGQGITLG